MAAPAAGKTDWSWVVYGAGNVLGARQMASWGLTWAAAVFWALAVICVVQLVVSARRAAAETPAEPSPPTGPDGVGGDPG